MCMNGAATGMAVIPPASRAIQQVPAQVNAGCCVAVAGTTMLVTAVSLIATTRLRQTASATSGFGWCVFPKKIELIPFVSMSRIRD